jgi:hypothetical protein
MLRSAVASSLRFSILIVTLALAVGCEPLTYTPPTPAKTDTPTANTRFSPTECGTISGRVTWAGEVPTVPHVDAYGPRINNGQVASAVVFLRTVDAARARPWDHEPVNVILNDATLLVEQGAARSTIGIVRVGDAVSLSTTTQKLGGIHARGASFFTHLIPPASPPFAKPLPRVGIVTLSSASRQPWANATLFVSDHPYYAPTSFEGRFTLRDVPSGEYELVAWHGNWHTTGLDRDPETGLPARHHYDRPFEVTQLVKVVAGQTQDVSFTLSDPRASNR